MLREVDIERRLEHGNDKAFDEPEDFVLVHKRHLDIDLRELGLPIHPQVLVTETLHDLEVPVEPRDHEELLVELGALGEGVELPGREPARDEEVTRAAGRVLDQEGRLELEAALVREVVARSAVDLVA